MADVPKVFISSTSKDLHAYRQEAINVCLRLDMMPQAMEFFEAMEAGATAGSKAKLKDCNVYVGIFAHRYGYIEEGYEQSVTELEYDYAGELGLERLIFMVDETWAWPPDAYESENQHKLRAFKERMNLSHIRANFTTTEVFANKLMQALIQWQKRHNIPESAKSGEGTEKQEKNVILPSLPSPPSLMIGRENDLDLIKTHLMQTSKPTSVIRGWPGVGKTTIVTALAYDEQILKAYPDGILWASIGEKSNILGELQKWGRALNIPMHGIKLEDASHQIRHALQDKQALLIIDDIWESDHAIPFYVAGSQCGMLMTTRFTREAQKLTTPDNIYLLPTLGVNQGIALLKRLTSSVVNDYLEECKQLVEDLEGLPLALRVAGRLLERYANMGWDVRDLFMELRESSLLLQEVAPEDRFDETTGTTPTMNLLFKSSTDRLSDTLQDYFAILGVFAPKPATFAFDEMQAMWEISEREAKDVSLELVDLGLLEPIPATGRFWLHAVLQMHAKSLLV